MLSDLVFVQLNASNRHNKYSPGICSSKGDHSTECLEGFWDPLVSVTLQEWYLFAIHLRMALIFSYLLIFCIGIGVYGARLTPRVCFGSFSLDIRGTVFFFLDFIYLEDSYIGRPFDLHWVKYLPSWFFIWSLGFLWTFGFHFIYFSSLRQKVVCLFMHNFACNMVRRLSDTILDFEMFFFFYSISFYLTWLLLSKTGLGHTYWFCSHGMALDFFLARTTGSRHLAVALYDMIQGSIQFNTIIHVLSFELFFRFIRIRCKIACWIVFS